MKDTYESYKDELGNDYFGAAAAANLAAKQQTQSSQQAQEPVEEATVVLNAELPDEKVVKNAAGDTMTVTAVLATTEERQNGYFYPESELQAMANQINKRGVAAPTTTPDGEHNSDFEEAMVRAGNNYEEARKIIKNKRGVLDDIRAYVEDNKLVAQMELGKNFQEVADMFNNISIETVSDIMPSGALVNSDLFTFEFTDKPQIEGAEVIDAS